MSIEFSRLKRLPTYVFSSVNELKMKLRRNGKDIIDFGMGNPDKPFFYQKHIVDIFTRYHALPLS